MRTPDFTAEDLNLFDTMVDRWPAWTHWRRQAGVDGVPVIVVGRDGERQGDVKVARLADGRYAAVGFGDWGLTVCDRLDQLLDIVAPKPSRSALAA